MKIQKPGLAYGLVFSPVTIACGMLHSQQKNWHNLNFMAMNCVHRNKLYATTSFTTEMRNSSWISEDATNWKRHRKCLHSSVFTKYSGKVLTHTEKKGIRCSLSKSAIEQNWTKKEKKFLVFFRKTISSFFRNVIFLHFWLRFSGQTAI